MASNLAFSYPAKAGAVPEKPGVLRTRPISFTPNFPFKIPEKPRSFHRTVSSFIRYMSTPASSTKPFTVGKESELVNPLSQAGKHTVQFMGKFSVDYEMVVSNRNDDARLYEDPDKDGSDCPGCGCAIM